MVNWYYIIFSIVWTVLHTHTYECINVLKLILFDGGYGLNKTGALILLYEIKSNKYINIIKK